MRILFICYSFRRELTRVAGDGEACAAGGRRPSRLGGVLRANVRRYDAFRHICGAKETLFPETDKFLSVKSQEERIENDQICLFLPLSGYAFAIAANSFVHRG
jgi:hypothetical protein